MCSRRGLTLLEVLLVLALMVVLATVVWSAMDRPWSAQRLRKAADVVRVAWVRAQVNAMFTGRTFVFRYEPQSNRYVVECWDDGDAEREAQSGDEWSGVNESALAAPSLLVTASKTLPEGILFTGGQSDLDQRAAFILSTFGEDSAETGRGGDRRGEGAWSDPILFYPDGTATNAELELGNEDGRRMTLALRGLTGVVTVGEVHSAEE